MFLGRLAQLVERFIDIEKVIGPIPIPPTEMENSASRGWRSPHNKERKKNAKI